MKWIAATLIMAAVVVAQDTTAVPDSTEIRDTVSAMDSLVSLVEPVNITELNSPDGDFAPYVSIDGKIIYFSSNRRGGLGGDDIWYAPLENGRPGKPQNIGAPIDSKYNEGTIAFSPDGKRCYLTICGRPDSYGGCDIYYSELTKDGWSEPKNIGRYVNSRDWDGHPCVSADGEWLYFSSERYGGYGGKDLYRIRLDTDTPTKAENLGYPINNARDQVSPFIHPDGKTLYFASSGHGGLGMLDIVKSTIGKDGKWGAPVNLGAPINTSENDYFFTVPTEGDIIYFASARAGGYGATDIYSYPLEASLRPAAVATLSGKVVDKETGKPVAATVVVEDLETGKVLFNRETKPETGEFFVVLPAGRRYGISVDADGYTFASQSFEIKPEEGFQSLSRMFKITPVQAGASVTLNNIFYDFGKAELRPESYSELDRVLKLFQNYPDMRIEVIGYADSIGSTEYNLDLSKRRAEAVRHYLLENGVKAEQVIARGVGEELPTGEIKSRADLKKSRRVEFNIISK